MSLSGLLAIADQMPAFRRLCESITLKGSIRTPLIDPARPYVLAAIQKALAGTMLVVTSQPTRARALVEQTRVFSSRPENVVYLPEHDSLFYEPQPVDALTVHQRVVAFDLLANRPGVLVVASVRALMHRVMPPEAFAVSRVAISIGQTIPPDALASRLLTLGYTPVPLVDEPGCFSRRGGIVDVFSVGMDRPVRLEFFGDEIDSVRSFDPATQRSHESLEGATLLPACEVLPEPSTDRLSRLAATLACQSGNRCLREDVRARWNRDLERLLCGEGFAGIEFYAPYLESGSPLDYLPGRATVVLDEPEQLRATAEGLVSQAEEMRADLSGRGELPADFPICYQDWPELLQSINDRPTLAFSWQDEASDSIAGLAESFTPVSPYGGRVKAMLDDVAQIRDGQSTVVIVTQQDQRLEELLHESGRPAGQVSEVRDLPPESALVLVHGSLAEGFALESGPSRLCLLTDREIFGWSKPVRSRPIRRPARESFLSELEVGGYAVHLEHGVGRYLGILRMAPDGIDREYLVLEYSDGDRLYVPTDHADRVNRYVGPGDDPPVLHRLGTADWVRTRSRVRAAVQSMAKELLALYAVREVSAGHAFAPDSTWQAEMENSFPYVETTDQIAAIRQIKEDMERPRPMDRLLCGDVGYGKTELAVRAAFKAVMDGKQVAVLVPTTVLAQQHFTTFRERLQSYPVRMEMLSRFRSEKEQREIVAALKDGRIDICIGTHRLIQKDVAFKDLGLVIVDEEQRFGVGHKEILKRLRREVDVLTLSATPIPRTLHMAMVGLRDMSTMDTPPEDRLPIKTYIVEHDEGLIREVILREVSRGGQVYFVHNRVQTIYQVAYRLQNLLPEVSIAVAHGQMAEYALERVMLEFSTGQHDVLACSTIIESGLDIPNVNTIVVDRADRLGLAQLYQLRGRVGRGANRAYAYFVYPKGRQLSEIAQKRLRTIFEATELGAGFRIAMKDLEIRGAGNLLGPEQHGHVAAVGFHLYTQLMTEAVAHLKGEEQKVPPSVALDLPLSAYLPASYVEDESARLSLYQRLAAVADLDSLGAITLELRDRFGPLPEPAVNLAYLVQIKLLAAQANVESIALEKGESQNIVLRFAPDRPINRTALQVEGDVGEVRLGRTQVRLPLSHRNSPWQDRLHRLLEAMAAKPAVGVPSGSKAGS